MVGASLFPDGWCNHRALQKALSDSDISEDHLEFVVFFQPKLKFRIINTVSDELDLLELETSTN